MARSGQVRVDITADASGVRRGAADAERSLNRLNHAGSKALKGLGIAAASAGVAIGAGLAAAAAAGTRELIEQEKASGRTANVLKTTGGVANVTTKQVEALSQKLQELTGSQDDVIQSGANVVLAFTKIRNEGAAPLNQIFDRTVAVANDLSVATGKDMTAAALQLGKALNDPIKGLGGLSRAGVQFTQGQKDQIKTMVDHGHQLEAQKLILASVEERFKGAAQAQGKTTEATQKLQRQWEDMSEALAANVLPIVVKVIDYISRHMPQIRRVTQETFAAIQRSIRVAMDWIDANVVPTIRKIVVGAQRFWDKFGADITAVFGFILRTVKRALVVLREIIELALAVLRGDWHEAWSSLKTIVRTTFAGIFDFLRTIPRRMASVGNQIGKALSNAIISALDGVGQSIVNKITSQIPGGSFSLRNIPGLPNLNQPLTNLFPASGAMLPGTYQGKDTMLTRVAPGEAILNPRQQEMLGGRDRIIKVLRATGGVVGGTGFAAGGVVGDAYERAVSKLGTSYRYGVWDCSKFATYVAGVNVGGSTASAWPSSKETTTSAGYGILWGFRNNASDDVYNGGPDEHMGVGIMTPNGTYRWFDNGGGGVQSDANSARWEHVRVPAGLEGVRIGSEGGIDTKANTRGKGRTLTPLQNVTRLLRASGAFGKVGAHSLLAKSLLSGAPDLSSGDAPGFSSRQQRSITSAGREAGAQARKDRKPPEEVSAAIDEAERVAEIAILRRQRGDAIRARAKLREAKADTYKAFVKLGRKKVGESGRAAKRKLMAIFRTKLRALDSEISEATEEIAQLDDRLQELKDQPSIDAYNKSFDIPPPAPGDPGDPGDPGTTDTSSISPDAQAAIDQANTRAATATRGAALSDALSRTLFNSGTIDPGAGFVTVNINTLHPGDPQIQGEVARWVVGALGGQGSVPTSAYAAGV
ncbi:MAG: phage tail length tape measure family protein [Actinobacteria bacterium]|nr:phage tail length tape measure family protein [Actinomycetota bacterium]